MALILLLPIEEPDLDIWAICDLQIRREEEKSIIEMHYGINQNNK